MLPGEAGYHNLFRRKHRYTASYGTELLYVCQLLSNRECHKIIVGVYLLSALL